MMTPGTYLVSAVGCKVNQYEAQQLREALEAVGLRPVDEGGVPDLAVVDTCAVTRSAARKSRQLVRRCTHRGQTRVIVVGCGIADEPERFQRIDGVLAVIGHDEGLTTRLSHILRAGQKPRPRKELSAVRQNPSTAAGQHPCGPWDDSGITSTASVRVGAAPRTSASTFTKAPKTDQVKWDLRGTVHRLVGHQRAFLKVQDGCDAACTYCIIPRLRRRLMSKPIEVACREAADLVAAGHREIVVTGICLGAYGRSSARRTLDRPGSTPLAVLLESLSAVPGLARIRLSSLDPGDVSDDLLDVMARAPSCVPHLHLPLQAGADEILRRMNRQYRIDAYLATIERVRKALDRPAITTDVIVGFPGETDPQFGQTLALVERVGSARVHAFPFSLRANTPAERWRDEQLPDDVLHDRMQRLQALADRTAQAYRRQFVGQSERVIVESHGPRGWQGRTDRYFPVTFSAPPKPDLRGRIVNVAIRSVTDDGVFGVLHDTE